MYPVFTHFKGKI